MPFSPLQKENRVSDESQTLFLHAGNVAKIPLVRMTPKTTTPTTTATKKKKTYNPSHRKPRLACLGNSPELRCDFDENFRSVVLKILCAQQKEKKNKNLLSLIPRHTFGGRCRFRCCCLARSKQPNKDPWSFMALWMFINCYDNTPSARLCLFNFPLLRLKSLTYVPEGRIQVFYFLSQHWRGPFFSHGALKMHILKP